MSKTIYFIPGTMCDQQLWQPTWRLLYQQYHEDIQLVHLVIPSEGHMDDVVNILARNIVDDNAILVGFSLGGYIASAIALKLRNKLKHLVIVSNFPKDLPLAETKQRQRTVDWINSRGYSGLPDKRIDDLLHPQIKQFNALGYVNIKKTMVEMDKKLGVDVLLHQISVSLQRPNLLPLLSQLPLDTTLLVGDADNLVDLYSLRQALAELYSNSFDYQHNVVLQEVPNTGHMLPLESPQVLAAVLIKLLSNSLHAS